MSENMSKFNSRVPVLIHLLLVWTYFIANWSWENDWIIETSTPPTRHNTGSYNMYKMTSSCSVCSGHILVSTHACNTVENVLTSIGGWFHFVAGTTFKYLPPVVYICTVIKSTRSYWSLDLCSFCMTDVNSLVTHVSLTQGTEILV